MLFSVPRIRSFLPLVLACWFFLTTSTNALVAPSPSSRNPFEIIQSISGSTVLDLNGVACSPLEKKTTSSSCDKSLVVLLPQLGEFDSSEFCEFLVAVDKDNKEKKSILENAGISLTVIGIGSPQAGQSFCDFTGLDRDKLFVDPEGALHQELDLYAGPGFTVPDFVSDEALAIFLRTLPGGPPEQNDLIRPVANAWLNYLAMCAGIGAPGTLPEILRGYFGDKSAPERFASDDVVKAGFVEIGPGVGPVRIGPLKYSNWWADERGYQRPVELATVRLKNMVEVLTKWDTYVSNPLPIAQRGGTFLFDNDSGDVLYEYRHRGVLTYSETMSRPLTFLKPYIGEEMATNPLGFLDGNGGEKRRGRGILKPLGKAMGLLGPIFSLENRIQAQALGADTADRAAARQEIESLLAEHPIVIFTYGLSPFSGEALALLDSVATAGDYHKVELGLEWFLLDKEKSAMRAELLEMTGQSSLPHIFINGKHVGGLFSGPQGGGPGLAALNESGELETMLKAL